MLQVLYRLPTDIRYRIKISRARDRRPGVSWFLQPVIIKCLRKTLLLSLVILNITRLKSAYFVRGTRTWTSEKRYLLSKSHTVAR